MSGGQSYYEFYRGSRWVFFSPSSHSLESYHSPAASGLPSPTRSMSSSPKAISPRNSPCEFFSRSALLACPTLETGRPSADKQFDKSLAENLQKGVKHKTTVKVSTSVACLCLHHPLTPPGPSRDV